MELLVQPILEYKHKIILRYTSHSQTKIVYIEPLLYYIVLNVAFVNLASYFIKKTDRNGEEIPYLIAINPTNLSPRNFPISAFRHVPGFKR